MDFNDGQFSPATCTCFANSDWTLSALSRPPCTLGNKAVPPFRTGSLSADQSGDLQSFVLQNNTLNNYVITLGTDELAQAKAQTALANDLSAAGADFTLTQAQVTSFQNTLKAQRFAALPAEEQSILNTYLTEPTDQQAVVNAILQIDPNSVPSSFIADLRAQAQDATTVGNALTFPAITNTTVPTLVTNFTEVDTTTNSTIQTNGSAYSGPVTGLQWQDVQITPDSLNITASVPDVFIHSGAGSDALQALSGTNVLDGGTGSNFLTGGSGTDTFFVDDRGPTADIWSTVNGFHAGDAATIWGVTPQDFSLTWADGQGATGYTGLTLHATSTGKPTASLTLTGYTSADLSNGRLSVSFGTDPGSGSAYMYVNGNS